MPEQNPELFYPASSEDWRNWLLEHHKSKQSVWLVYYKKQAGKPTISWSEAVDEALCFGWIDSTKKTLDAERFIQFFTKRKATGTWSKINKEKVEKLLAEKRMTEAGLEIIQKAKENGSWTVLDAVEELSIPQELEAAFEKYAGAKDFFLGLSKSMRKRMLYWIVAARRDETRQKRAEEMAELASRGEKPKQF